MEIPQTPLMDDEGLATFKMHLNGTRTYLEYGCGGSTVLAAKAGVKHIFGVDTARDWIEAVRENTKGFDAQINLSHCDVGELKDWGFPVDDSRVKDFHRYAVLPWEAAEKAGRVPDLVLIDGRFRVASFLYSLLSAPPGMTILFDDYTNRPQYHVVEQFCKRTESCGRMGVFEVSDGYRLTHLARTLSRYSIVAE
ncbi:class I SAM-dependent methyltransferase [Burkholderia multivorans]|nr:hypothetical protein [Burkholderia multivorans]MDI3305351.1 class I SAM-dependent methyltransferase [Burkholderia multivorans]MDN7654302.1 class I SAM-dependent methyltransferase [Burkholderia multivorans]